LTLDRKTRFRYALGRWNRRIGHKNRNIPLVLTFGILGIMLLAFGYWSVAPMYGIFAGVFYWLGTKPSSRARHDGAGLPALELASKFFASAEGHPEPYAYHRKDRPWWQPDLYVGAIDRDWGFP
jgi:hypothetical protein